MENGKTYYFRVRAYADYKNSSSKKKTRTWSQYSNIVKIKLTSSMNSIPVRQKMKSVQNSARGILVKWAVSSNAEGYAVYRKTGEGGSWKHIADVSGRKKNTYLDQSVKDKNGQTYYYTVRRVIGSLKSGKTWYFRVRSYRKAGSTVSRSGWSPVKTVSIK